MLANGTLLGPYRILCPLGQGGMGEVYRALDTRLGRDVAVKVISAHVAHDPDRIRRFEQEARAAGALSHPNVCAIFDIGQHDGSPFVVMELLEGESLRARLKQGPIPARKALDWAAQAAQGLAAAHEKGIVHRDLKPENLFLTKDGHLKVLDFGLAKLTRPEATAPAGADTLTIAATQAGEVLGTAGYMAPEQVRGEPVDHRADIFTLGSILYELLTGTRAFAGASFYETSYRIVNEDPPPLSASGRPLPAGVEAVVRRCLEKLPRERFQSARDLGFALDSVRESGSGSAAASGAGAGKAPARPLVRWGSRVAAVLAGVALVAVIGVVVVRQAHRGGGEAAAEADGVEPKRVVVAIFENRTGEASLDALGRMLADQITDGLSRIGIEVMPTSYVADAAAKATGAAQAAAPDAGLAVAEATGSGILVSGDYSLNDTTLQVRAKITDTVSHKILSVIEPTEGPRDDPVGVVEGVIQKVRDALGSRLLGTESMRKWTSSYEGRTPRYEAYAELILAEEAGRMSDVQGGIDHARKATELDPDFVQAHLFLADGLAWQWRYEEATRVIEQAEQRRGHLSPLGRLDLDAVSFQIAHHYEWAANRYREIVQMTPGDVRAKLALAQYLMQANRPREVVQLLEQPAHWEIILNPNELGSAGTYLITLANALGVLGEHERGLAVARRGLELSPNVTWYWWLEGRALIALGRLDELESLVRKSLNQRLVGGGPENIMLDAALELRAHGYMAESVTMAHRAVVWIRDLPDESDTRKKGAILARCLWLSGELGEAAELYTQLAGESSVRTLELSIRGHIGQIAAAQGDRETALRIVEELKRLRTPYLFGVDTYSRARIAAQLGDKDQAVDLLRRAVAEGLTFDSKATNPFAFAREPSFESLRGYPPFEELMKPSG